MTKVYQNTIIELIEKLLSVSQFNGNDWTFQQDFAHKAKTTQRYLKDNMPDLRELGDWTSSRQDLNPFGQYMAKYGHIAVTCGIRGKCGPKSAFQFE
ncbi:hypothetical protein TNCV_184071 [Trichonephila clavipes]|nr:hypothetical protein TNCV_184071 [Trichonephila clavipes]